MSVLQKQIVQILLKGLNQKNPDAIGVPGGLGIAQNVRIDRGQEAGFELVRRNGLVEVADTVAGSGFRMSSYGGAIVAHTLTGFERLNPTNMAFSQVPDLTNFWAPAPPIAVGRSDWEVDYRAFSGASTPTQTAIDHALYNGLAFYCWIDQDSRINYQIRNLSAGILLVSNTVFVTASNTKVVQLGGVFYMFWKEANAIKALSVSATAPYTASAATTVVAAASCLAGTDYDIQAGFDATHVALMYRIDATHHGRALVSTAFAVSGLVSDATVANQPDVAMCWIPQNSFGASLYYGTLNAASGSKIQAIDKATLAITATTSSAGAVVTNVKNMTGFVSSYPRLLIESTYTDANGVVRHRVSVSDGTDVTTIHGLASRAFYLGGAPYVALVYNSTQAAGTVAAPQPTYFIGEPDPTLLGQIEIVGKLLPGRAGAYTAGHLSSVGIDTDGTAHFAGQNAVSVETQAGALITQYGLSDLSAALASRRLSAPLEVAGVMLAPSGELFEMDNSTKCPHEQGFDLVPEIPVLTEGAAASGSVAPGTRSYVTRWKWIDSASQKMTSAVSTPVPVTTANVNSSVSISGFCNVQLSARDYVHLEIFRTPVGGTGDQYFKVTPAVYMAKLSATGVFTFVDTASETTLAAGEPLALSNTIGTVELENIAPPALSDIIEHKGHVVGISSEEPWKVVVSKSYTPGTSIGFTDAFFITVSRATPLHKVMSMDGHLIGISDSTIYVWAGDFPDNTGAGDFPSATQLPVGVGTDQPRSAVLTDLGIIFYSSKRGFWLLTRSLGVEYIGAPVETTAAGQTVSGATVHPTYPEVRFTTEGGTTFVLNTYFTRVAGSPMWTTFTAQACVHSIVHGGDWYLLTSAGKLLKEDLTRWQDGSTVSGSFVAGAAYTAKVKISDLNFAGIGGLGRVWRGQLLGQWYDSHKVKVSLTLNHRSVAGQVFTFDATADPDPYQLEFRLNAYESKQTSMNVTIEDTTDFQTRAFAWDALMFVIGVKPGLFRRGKNFAMVGN